MLYEKLSLQHFFFTIHRGILFPNKGTLHLNHQLRDMTTNLLELLYFDGVTG